MVTQEYVISPTGQVTMISPEGIRTTYAPSGVSATTPPSAQPSQVSYTYQKVGINKLGGIILEKTDSAGNVTREIVPPKKWESMRKEHFAQMSPEEKEASRLETVKTITETPIVQVGQRKMTFQEWRQFEGTAVQRAQSLSAKVAYGGSTMLSTPIGLVGSVLGGERGVTDFLASTRQSQIDVQKQMMLNPEITKDPAWLIERAIEPAALGIGIGVSSLLSTGVGTTIAAKPIFKVGTAALSGYLFAKGTTEFIGAVPIAMYGKTSVERGRAIRKGSVGVFQMGVGAYGLQKSYEGLYPKPVKVKITTVGEGRAFHRVDKKDFVGLKETDMLARVGDKKYVASAVSDYHGTVTDKSMLKGFGQVNVRYREVGGATVGKTQAVFQTKVGKIDAITYYGQTAYTTGQTNIVSMFYTGGTTNVVQAGIDLNIKEALLTGNVKGVETLTKVQYSYSTGHPLKTFTISAGEGLKGGEITHLSYIKHFKAQGFKTYTGGVTSGLKTSGVVVGDVGSQIGQDVLKDTLKGFVQPPPAPKTFVVPLSSQAQVKTSQKLTFLKTTPDLKTDIKVTTEQKTSLKSKGLRGIGITGGGLKITGIVGIEQKPIELSVVTTTQAQSQGIRTTQQQKLNPNLETTLTTSPAPITPTGGGFVPLLGLGQGSTRKRRTKGRAGYKRKRIYAPSVSGVFLDVKFKKHNVKLETGARIRGVKKTKKVGLGRRTKHLTSLRGALRLKRRKRKR